jgi:hypothetical protein
VRTGAIIPNCQRRQRRSWSCRWRKQTGFSSLSRPR